MYADLHRRSRKIAVAGASLLPIALLCVVFFSASFMPLTPPRQPAVKTCSSITFRAVLPAQAQASPAPVKKPSEDAQAPPLPTQVKKTPTRKTPAAKKIPSPKINKKTIRKKTAPSPAKRPASTKKKIHTQHPTEKRPATPVTREPTAVSSQPAITSREKHLNQNTIPASAHPSETDIALAIQEVATAVDRYKKYPKAARRAGYGGQVKLRIYLSAAGKVMSCSISKSSGRSRLDKAALDAANSLAGQNIISVTLTEDLAVVVPVRFSLQ